MPTLVSHPDEVKIISRRFGAGAADIEKYLELDGYKAVQLAIEKELVSPEQQGILLNWQKDPSNWQGL